MSHWDSEAQRIVDWPDTPWEGYPGWTAIDCGCCAGLEWGGETPRECRRCPGGGVLARHDATGTLAAYPGGPLLGREAVAA